MRNEALVGREADPDGDGVINLAEYAFVRDPRAADAPVFVLDVHEDGGTVLTLSFTRPRKALDLTYTVETAEHPAGPWASGALTNGPALFLSNGLERVSFRTPASSAPAGFLRVRVTQ
jgi:hypothetical protein